MFDSEDGGEDKMTGALVTVYAGCAIVAAFVIGVVVAFVHHLMAS